MELLVKGSKNRHVGATSMNMESSRSHSIFSLFVESKVSQGGVWKTRRSQFHFVDLAGSERQKKTEAKGERLKEGCNINKSLTVLGGVISALVETTNGKKVHVRYRDSKLTFLLRDSLGGNSKTAMIANISPASSTFHETLSTLQFAQRAKLIKNKAKLNEDTSGDTEALRLEIVRLKEELESARCIIQTFEMMQPLCSDSDDGTSSGSSVLINRREVFASDNQRAIEVETMLGSVMQLLFETQSCLNFEISRKSSVINAVEKAFSQQHKVEMHLRMINNLSETKLAKLPKLKKLLDDSTCSSEEQKRYLEVVSFVENVLQERDHYRSCLLSMPTNASVFKENLVLQSRLSDLEGFAPKQLAAKDTIGILQRLVFLIEEGLKERTRISSALCKDNDEPNLIEVVDNLRKELADLQEQKKVKELKEREMEELIRDLRSSVLEAKTENEMKDQLLRQEIDSLKAPSKQCMMIQEHIQLEDKKDEKVISEYEKLLEIATERAESLTIEREVMVQKMDSRDLHIKDLKLQVEQQRVEISKYIQVEKILSRERDEMAVKVNRFRNENEQLKSEKSELSKNCQSLLKETQKLKKKLVLKAPEEATYQDQQYEAIAHFTNEENWSSQIDSLRLELSKSEEERMMAEESLSFFKEEFDKQGAIKDKEIKDLKAQLAKLTKTPRQSLQLDAAQAGLSQTTCSDQVAALSLEISSLKSQTTEAENIITNLRQENSHCCDRISQLTEMLRQSKCEEAAAREELREMNNQKDTWTKELEENCAMNNLLSTENQSLTKKIKDSEAKTISLENKLIKKREQLKEIKLESREFQACLQEAQEQLQIVRKEFAALKVTASYFEDEKVSILKKLAASEDFNEEWRTKCSNIQKEANKYKSMTNLMHNSVMQYMSQIEGASTDMLANDLMEACKSKEHVKLLESEIEKRNKKIEEMQGVIEWLTITCRKEMAHYKNSFKVLEQEYTKSSELFKWQMIKNNNRRINWADATDNDISDCSIVKENKSTLSSKSKNSPSFVQVLGNKTAQLRSAIVSESHLKASCRRITESPHVNSIKDEQRRADIEFHNKLMNRIDELKQATANLDKDIQMSSDSSQVQLFERKTLSYPSDSERQVFKPSLGKRSPPKVSPLKLLSTLDPLESQIGKSSKRKFNERPTTPLRNRSQAHQDENFEPSPFRIVFDQ